MGHIDGEAAAELERVTELLAQERATFRAELEQGAGELARRDEQLERVRAKRDRAVAQRNRARAQLAELRASRLVRISGRVSRGVRRLRGRA